MHHQQHLRGQPGQRADAEILDSPDLPPCVRLDEENMVSERADGETSAAGIESQQIVFPVEIRAQDQTRSCVILLLHNLGLLPPNHVIRLTGLSA
jgi:hypothetical protein